MMQFCSPSPTPCDLPCALTMPSGRIGGEEFLILLPGCDRLNAVSHAERIRSAISRIAMESKSGQSITISAQFRCHRSRQRFRSHRTRPDSVSRHRAVSGQRIGTQSSGVCRHAQSRDMRAAATLLRLARQSAASLAPLSATAPSRTPASVADRAQPPGLSSLNSKLG